MSKIEIITHLSDVHVMNYQKLAECKAAMDRFLFDMKDVVKPDRIVITGDLIHAKNQPSPEASDLAGWFLKECADITITVYILGNHDFVEENKDRLDAITPIINQLNHPSILFLKDSGVYSDQNVNWVVYSLYDDIIPKTPVKKSPDERSYGLYHGKIQGAKTNTDYKFEDGVNTKLFNDLDGVFCGDLHNRFVLTNNIGAPIIMVGSFTQQTYRENLSEHGYCVFKTEDNSYEFVDIESRVKYMTFQIFDVGDIEVGGERLLNK